MSYHDAFKHGIDQSFDEEPSSLAVYWKILGEMNAGVYRRGYVDVVVQRALDQHGPGVPQGAYVSRRCRSQR